MEGFERIAPYLMQPLVLAGFVAFLFFGLLRLLLKAGVIPTLPPTIGGRIVQSFLRYGFVLALVVIFLGFALEAYRVRQNEGSVEREAARERKTESIRKNLQGYWQVWNGPWRPVPLGFRSIKFELSGTLLAKVARDVKQYVGTNSAYSFSEEDRITTYRILLPNQLLIGDETYEFVLDTDSTFMSYNPSVSHDPRPNHLTLRRIYLGEPQPGKYDLFRWLAE